jgi:3-dehydroquinate synthase
MKEIQVRTESSFSRVLLGEKLENLGEYCDKNNLVIITDKNIQSHYHDKFHEKSVIAIDTGEGIKTLDTVQGIYQQLLDHEVDRATWIIGIGGGIVCDIAGYVASTYLRGLPFGFVSTSLLSQVDASVGGKNGVNFLGYKNMIGTFSQPSFVICDVEMLQTLPREEFVAGFAEIAKHGAIKLEDHFKFLEKNYQKALALDKGVLENLIHDSVAIKAAVVIQDEREKGERRKLNFGHTFGHAIEKNTKIIHGEAVSIGMVLAARLSSKLGLLPYEDTKRITRLLENIGLPVESPLAPSDLFSAMKQDKKREKDEINLVLLERVGSAIVKSVPLKKLEEMLHDLHMHS